jgi:hypothetical protein
MATSNVSRAKDKLIIEVDLEEGQNIGDLYYPIKIVKMHMARGAKRWQLDRRMIYHKIESPIQ